MEADEIYFIDLELDLRDRWTHLPANATMSDVEKFHHSLLRYRERILEKSLERSYCSCGWPYNLLYPRGSKGGMGFKLVLYVSDWTKDRVADDDCCTSLSFCGAKDRYPDARPMGYPFDRLYTNKIEDTLRMLDNVALHHIVIKCRNI
jgi:hypothetical protein